jgi:hypothetical protein
MSRTNRPAYLNPQARYVIGDVADPGAWFEATRGVDGVCHQAARVGLGVPSATSGGTSVIAYGIGGALVDADRTQPAEPARWVIGAAGYGRDDTIPSLLDRNDAWGLAADVAAVFAVAAVMADATRGSSPNPVLLRGPIRGSSSDRGTRRGGRPGRRR